MDQEGIPPPAGDGDDVARLVALTERQHDLWALLRDAEDEGTRNQLFDELSANREELGRLKERVSAEVLPNRSAAADVDDPPAPRTIGEELRAKILTTDQVAPPVQPPPPPPPPVIPSAAPVVDSPIVNLPVEETVDRQDDESVLSPPASEETAPLPSPAAPESATAESSEQPRAPGSGLAPESTPYSSREADLAAIRARREAEVEDVSDHARVPSASDPTVKAQTAEPKPEPTVKPQAAEPELKPKPEPAPEKSAPASVSTTERRSAREEERLASAHAALQELEKVRPKHARSFPVVAVIVAVLAVAAVAWVLFFWPGDATGSEEPPATTTSVAAAVETSSTGQIRAVLDGLGLGNVAVEERSGTIFLVGIVATDQDRTAAIGAATALAGDAPLDASGMTVAASQEDIRLAALQAITDAGYDKVNVTVSGGVATLTGVTPDDGAVGLIAAVSDVPGIDQVVDMTEASDRAAALNSELQRITSVTPLIFASGQTDLNALQERILDNVAEAVKAYPGPLVTVVGYTDSAGSEQGNLQVSLTRAENVAAYLTGQGID